MANPNRVCKYYVRGTCLKGEQCCYSHETKKASAGICSFYQKGNCAYGGRCRYTHVKAFQTQTSASSAANGPQSVVSDSGTAQSAKGQSSWVPKATKMPSPFDKHARSLQYKHQHSQGNGGEVGESSGTAVTSEHLFCAFDAANCPSGDKCSSIHGQPCLYCKKPCLHPTNRKQRQKHLKTCEEKVKPLKDSEDIECRVCLERVLLKPRPAQRKLGLLPECDHAFCLSCIRKWRNSAPTYGMDCPVCRRQSSFVIPSDIWYATEEEKQAIIDNYEANCKLTDCKHFNFGMGHCPFGPSCLYKHTVKPGTYKHKQNRPPPPRRANNFVKYDMLDMLNEFDLESGELYSIMKDSQFINDMYPFEMMALSEALANGSNDEDMDYFRMADLPEAVYDGADDFDFEDWDDDEFNPMEAAILSMMMSSNMGEECSDDEYSDEDD